MSEITKPGESDKIEVPKSQLEALLKQNDEYKADVKNLLIVAYGICGVLGLMDSNGKVKEAYLSGDESPMGSIIKSITSTVVLMTQAKVPGLGRAAEEEMAQKFAFIKHLVPIINKYQSDAGK